MFSHAQFLLIKHRKIFERFNCFWKVFCFVKNFKNCVALFWRLGLESVQSLAPCHEHHSENIRDSLVGQSSSREKYLEKFSKSRFLGFSRLRLVTCSQVKAPIARVTPKFLRLPSRLPLRWNFQSQKTLRKIFQKFHLRCLAACPGNLNMTWFNRENHVFYPLGTVFKTFQFSFEHF